MTNIDRIRRMDAHTLGILIDKFREDDVDYGEGFCSQCVQTAENGMDCAKCAEWWLNLDVNDNDYYCVDFQMR